MTTRLAAPASEADIARRLPVWRAMSDLFLDTWYDAEDMASIGDILRTSGFTPAELRAIFHDEVAPAFAGNLLSHLGEWQGWSDDELRRSILGPPPSGWRRVEGAVARWLLRRRLAEIWASIDPASRRDSA